MTTTTRKPVTPATPHYLDPATGLLMQWRGGLTIQPHVCTTTWHWPDPMRVHAGVPFYQRTCCQWRIQLIQGDWWAEVACGEDAIGLIEAAREGYPRLLVLESGQQDNAFDFMILRAVMQPCESISTGELLGLMQVGHHPIMNPLTTDADLIRAARLYGAPDTITPVEAHAYLVGHVGHVIEDRAGLFVGERSVAA